jgi:filamentous hemagglutinin family protein
VAVRKRLLPIGVAAALAWGGAAHAQPASPPTDIAPDIATPLSLGTTTSRSGPVTTIDGGTRAGANLFHSFSRFDLGQGDVARWVQGSGDGASIAHIINRVTGGDASHISGTIDSTALPNADFWFINPAGVIFGAGAELNVPAAAHFTTAQELRFASGPAFTVATPGGSTFSIAAPAAFGFVGGQGAISVTDAGTGFLPPAGRLTLTASDVTIADSTVAGRGFGVVAVGAGPASLSAADPRADSGGGTVSVAGSILRSTGNDGILLSGELVNVDRSNLGTSFMPGPTSGHSGPIDLFGREVTILSSLVSASTFGAERAGEIRIAGEHVLIGAGSMVASETLPGSTGEAGAIRINGGLIEMVEGARVTSSTLTAARGGDVVLAGTRIRIDDAQVAADSGADAIGGAGSIDISGGTLEMANGAAITSQSASFGDAGSIAIAMADLLSMDSATISSDALGQTGRSGTISIAAPHVLLDHSHLTSSTQTDGAAGIIGIQSDDIALSAGSVVESRAERGASGDAGLIFILSPSASGRLLVTGGSALISDTSGSGDAGGVFIATGAVELRDGGVISSDAGLGCREIVCGRIGSAGAIDIRADRLLLDDSDSLNDPTRISSDSFGDGHSGDVSINVGALSMTGFTDISSDTFGAGAGGGVTVAADTIAMEGPSSITTSTFGSGRGGSIILNALHSISMMFGARIVSASSEIGLEAGDPDNPITGAGGSIRLAAPVIELTGATISSSSFSQGAAGSIDIAGATLLLDSDSLVSTATFNSGTGGPIRIDVDDLTVTAGSTIDADSFCLALTCDAAGAAGDIDIVAHRVALTGTNDEIEIRSRISSSTDGAGAAGNVHIIADGLFIDRADIISQTSGRGDAGTISLELGDLILDRGATIGTNALACFIACELRDEPTGGNGGDIQVSAHSVSLFADSIVSSSTAGLGNAGIVSIAADGRILLADSQIATVATPEASGGSGVVSIGAGELLLLNGRIVTNSSNAREAGGILIDAPRIILAGADAAISSANDFAGVGDAGAIFMTTDRLSLLNGARLTTSSANGAAGSVEIFTPDDGLVLLMSQGTPSLITTSSGPGTGGRIFINHPLAIVTDGGQILALGQTGGANVQIATDYFIRSADRANRVAVDGNFLLEATVGDVSSGTVNRDLTILDASGVLRGQCASARATGQVSQLAVRPIGPFGARTPPAPAQRQVGARDSAGMETCS